MKTIKESELREIIQEELVNELFGLFKKKKRKPVHPSYNKTSLETRGFKRIREFFGVLDEIKKQITGPQQQKILQILNSLPKDETRYLEEYRKYANKAATGIYSFYSFIMPVLDIFEENLNESTKYPPNDLIAAGYNLYFLIDESYANFQTKYTYFLQTNKKLIIEFIKQASPLERKRIKSNILLFKRLKAYFDQYDIQDEVFKGTTRMKSLSGRDSMYDREEKFNSNISRPAVPGQRPTYLSQVSSARR